MCSKKVRERYRHMTFTISFDGAICNYLVNRQLNIVRNRKVARRGSGYGRCHLFPFPSWEPLMCRLPMLFRRQLRHSDVRIRIERGLAKLLSFSILTSPSVKGWHCKDCSIVTVVIVGICTS